MLTRLCFFPSVNGGDNGLAVPVNQNGQAGPIGLVMGTHQLVHASLRIHNDLRHIHDALVIDLYKTIIRHMLTSFPLLPFACIPSSGCFSVHHAE